MARKAEAPKGEAFLPCTSAAELRKMAKRADNGIDSIRYMAMYMRKCGREIKEISDIIGSPHETVRRWLTRAHREGIAAVPHRKGGSHCKITLEQRAELFTDVILTRPWEHGYETNAWDDRTARMHVEKTCGQPYSPSGAHRLFRRIGLHPMSPRPEHPLALDAEEQEAKARSIRTRMQYLYRQGFKVQGGEDECHVRVNDRPTRALGATGCRPQTVPSSGPGGSVTLFVAVVEGAVCIMRSKTGGNGKEFIRFTDILTERFGKVVLLIDNASYHKSPPVNEHLKKNHDRLRVIYLPRYTPPMAIAETEMGPIKRAVARRTPESKKDVWTALCAAGEKGEIPVSKLFDWMRIRDPGRKSRADGPAYERDGDVIIIRRSSLPEAPKRAKLSKGRKDEDDNILSFEEYTNLPECILESDGPLIEPYKLIPCSVLRNIPPGLARP